MDLPKQFLERMKNIVPDFDGFVKSYDKQPIKSFFVNQNKILESDFCPS